MKKKLVEAITGELNLTEQASTGGYNKNNTTTSQCGSRFRGVWGDPAIGNITSTGITLKSYIRYTS